MAAALCRPKLCGGGELAGKGSVNEKAVVISLAIVEGGEIGLDLLSYYLGLHKVHGGSGYVFRCTQRDEGFVGGKPLGGVELQFVVKDAARCLSVQVQIYVVGEVHYGGFVGLGRQDELEGVVFSPGVVGHYLEVAGIAFLSVFGKIHEFYGISLDTAVPDLVGKALGTTVQVVGAVVDGKGILHAVQREMAPSNAVGVTSGDFAGEGTVSKVILRGFVTQRDIGQFAFPVGYDDGYDACSHAAELHIGARSVFERVEIDFFSVGRSAPDFFGNSHSYLFFRCLQRNQAVMARPTTEERTDASAPKAPPVSQSGPETSGCSQEAPASVPDTAKPKTLPWTKFQDQWMPMGNQRFPAHL